MTDSTADVSSASDASSTTTVDDSSIATSTGTIDNGNSALYPELKILFEKTDQKESHNDGSSDKRDRAANPTTPASIANRRPDRRCERKSEDSTTTLWSKSENINDFRASEGEYDDEVELDYDPLEAVRDYVQIAVDENGTETVVGCSSDPQQQQQKKKIRVVVPRKMRICGFSFYYPGPKTIVETQSILRIDGVLSFVIGFLVLVSASKTGSDAANGPQPTPSVIRAAVAFGIMATLCAWVATVLTLALYFTLDRLHRTAGVVGVAKLSFTGATLVFSGAESMFMLASYADNDVDGFMAFSCGIVAVPLFCVLFGFETFYLFIRPKMVIDGLREDRASEYQLSCDQTPSAPPMDDDDDAEGDHRRSPR